MIITDINGSVTLSNGVKMPYLGLGVYLMKEGNEIDSAIKFAFQKGYRHIDTASLYENEKGVGKAVNTSNMPRSEIFVTTKVWNSDQGYDSTLKAFDKSLKLLNMPYVDLYLIHWPVKGKYKETWKAMEQIYKSGRAKAIGVSNFLEHQLVDLFTVAEIKPMVNQVEFHPLLVQQNLIDFCKQNNIQYQAWSPLMQGKVFEIELLKEIASKYKKTVAQIVLRWNLQKGVVTIPKSVNHERIIENSQIFDFEISDEDVKRIDSLDKNSRIGADPDNFNF
jgi:methylglyoxal/glyoxal reductase